VSFAAFYASYTFLPLHESSGRGAVANVLAYAAGLVNSFVLNRIWTFRAEGHVGAHALKFFSLNAVTLVGSTAIVWLLVDRAGWPALSVWLPLTLAILATHYLGMKHWAFAERR
jgi:putative flippase GtrA